MLYFKTHDALRIHSKIIERSGGLNGLRDKGQLDSILQHIQNDCYYPEFEDKLTHLVFSVNKFHVFVDGNKRASLALGAFFLKINGFENLAPKFITEMENISVYVAENKISRELLKKIIFSILYEEHYSEETLLDLYRAIS